MKFAALVVGVAASTPLDIVIAKVEQFSGLYNAQNFAGVQELYADSALLVPPTADAFLTKDAIGDFFKGAYKHAGIRNLSLTPFLAQLTPDGKCIHELGTVSSTGTTGPYYIRWTKVGDDWKIDTDLMAIGDVEQQAGRFTMKAVNADAAALAAATALETDLANKYNAQNFSGIQTLYADSAVFVPNTVDAFIPKANVGEFFSKVYHGWGIRNLALTPHIAKITHGGKAMHEIGIASSLDGYTIGPYYIRFVLDDGGEWRIETDIMSVAALRVAPSEAAAKETVAPFSMPLFAAVGSAMLAGALAIGVRHRARAVEAGQEPLLLV